MYRRLLDLAHFSNSCFVFGPRMTGKTSLLKQLQATTIFDLLDPDLELRLKHDPKLFYEQIQALPKKSKIIIDEVQRVPALLDYVQMGIEKFQHQFYLSGSSARKLKRGSANLLGGRAVDLRLHALTHQELGKDFDLDVAITYGTLPKIFSTIQSGNVFEAQALLRSYVTTYLKEEIQAEALVRNVGAFQRFLRIAAQMNGEIVEYQSIARDSSNPASTVKEYFSILEDTLIGNFLWQWDASERKKSRPKFYFFDTGVVRAINGELSGPPSSRDLGYLFETFFIQEVIRFNDYYQLDLEFSYWRHGSYEMDLLISKAGKMKLAIEIKSEKNIVLGMEIQAFQKKFPNVPILVASLHDSSKRIVNQIEVLPWKEIFLRLR